jgi:uncharacterized protein (DUF885 family)
MKIFYAILGAAVILACCLFYNFYGTKAKRFNFFVERASARLAMRDPELLSNLGIFDFNSHKLTDISYKKNKGDERLIRKVLANLHRYDPAALPHQERLTFEILDHYLKSVLGSASFGYGSLENISNSFNPYPVNQLFGVQNSLPDFMVNIHRVVNRKSAWNYIARLKGWDKKFGQLIEELKLREKNGVVLPQFLIEKVLEETRGFIEAKPRDNILFTTFQSKLAKIDLPMKQKEKIEKKALDAIQTNVYPAYRELIAFLQGQKERATNDAGVWKFPNGKAYYEHALRFHTTTSHTPDEVHALGLAEVERLQSEMRHILDRIGYGRLGFKEAMEALGNDPRFLYPDTDLSRKQIIKDFQTIFDQSKDRLPELFSRLPKAELKIEPVPEFKAKTAPVAYYEPGDLKGVRPGVFYANTHDLTSQTKFTMPTLAYHEGLPGHHLQIALAQEIPNLPTFRKVVNFTAYVEGWALYCEQLASEFGFTTSPEHELGRLQFELMRAVRLVVDTGIHHMRWSREQAIEYMTREAGLGESEVAVEIDRYIVIPGQACSYKIGMIKLLELREKMKNRLGLAFDIKQFHEAVLESGSMPLSILEEQI